VAQDEPRLEAFVEILRQLREPYLIVSAGGGIVAANVASAEALGTSIATLEGGSLADYSPDPVGLRQRITNPLADAPFPLRGRDGRRFSCEKSALQGSFLLLRLSGGPEGAHRAGAFIETLTQLHGTTADSFMAQALGDLSRAVLTRAMQSLGIVAAGLYLLDASGANLELKWSVGYSDENSDRFRLISRTASTPINDAIKLGLPVLLDTPEAIAARYPAFSGSYTQRRAAAIACMPLEVHGTRIGGLGLGFPQPRTFDDQIKSALRALAQQCAEVFEWADRLAAAAPTRERTASRLERLHVFTRALAQAVTPTHVAEAVVDMGMAATSARSGGLWLLSEDASTVTLERSVGPVGPRSEDYVRVPLDRPQRMPILDAIREGQAVWIESCRQLETRYPEVFRTFSRGRESALACIPLSAQGRCIGGLAYNFEGGRRFDEDERTFLHLISWHSAHAIERSRLYAAQQRAREAAVASQKRSDFLAEVGSLLASSLDYSSTLVGLARAAVPRFANWCVVDLQEQREKGLPPAASHVDTSRVPLVLQFCARLRTLQALEPDMPSVLRSGKPKMRRYATLEQVREWARGDAELCHLFERLGIGASMVVPISARGRTFGVIVLNAGDSARAYDEQDLAMAVELGCTVGLAIDNARLYQEARQADRQKDEFLAMLSHELRNPLTPIIAAAELMKVRDPHTFSKERTIIARNANHIVRLVDDLLDVARLTRGKIDLHLELCDLSSLIANAVETMIPLVEAHAQRLTVSAPAAGVSVMADPVRLTQAIMNLLANSVKYTGRGGEIAIVAAVEGSQVVLRVRDSGIGIAPEMLPRVFDLFVQERGALDPAHGGLGIGLTVVKTLVELHGGTVSAQSEGKKKGSEFVIRLPLASDSGFAAAPATTLSLPAAAAAAGGLRVLVVDDNADAAGLIGEALGIFGCSVRIAHDGASALVAAREFEPDLALVDIGLPILNGYEVAERLRRMHVAPKRIVAVSGYGQGTDRLRSREAGFDEHIVKPLGLDALRKLVTGGTHEQDAHPPPV
jgi:signal transduction histidine kinase/ActR/RegA family two-component response regulator